MLAVFSAGSPLWGTALKFLDISLQCPDFFSLSLFLLVAGHHKLGGLKQHKLIILWFQSSEVWIEFQMTEIKGQSTCFFFPVSRGCLHPLVCVSTPSVSVVIQCSLCELPASLRKGLDPPREYLCIILIKFTCLPSPFSMESHTFRGSRRRTQPLAPSSGLCLSRGPLVEE